MRGEWSLYVPLLDLRVLRGVIARGVVVVEGREKTCLNPPVDVCLYGEGINST